MRPCVIAALDMVFKIYISTAAGSRSSGTHMTGVVKDWLLIGLSALLYSAPVTKLNLFGYGIAFLAVLWCVFISCVSWKSTLCILSQRCNPPCVAAIHRTASVRSHSHQTSAS